MKPGQTSKVMLVLAVLAATLVPGGCGRKGALEPPGAAERPPMTPPTVIGGMAGPKPAPVETPAPKRPFLLDPLI